MNRLTFMGRLCNDPEIRYGGGNNTTIANFRIAVEKRFKRDGEQTADFFLITAIGKTGEFAEKYLKKGTKVLIDGEIHNNNYTNKDGQTVYRDQILANSIEFCESKATQESNGFVGGGNTGNPNPAPKDNNDWMDLSNISDDEVPFS